MSHHNYKCQLQEWCQKYNHSLPQYQVNELINNNRHWFSAIVHVYNRYYHGPLRTRKRDAEAAVAEIAFFDLPVLELKPSKFKAKHFGGIIRVKSNDTYEYVIVQGRASGKWSFPKGHSKPGELPLECAKREIEEESGIAQCLLNKPLQCVRLAHGKYYVFDAPNKVELNTLDSFEVIETKWATIEDMCQLPINIGIQTFLKKAFYKKLTFG